MRTGLVLLHVTAGVVGLVAGLPSMSPPRPGDGRSRWRLLYLWCVVLLLAGLVGLVVHDWADLDAVARLAFGGLAGLGLAMVIRLLLAWRAAGDGTDGTDGSDGADGSDGRPGRYVGHVYFTYVSLWIGFLIVPAINSPIPQVAVPAVVVLVLAVGSWLVSRYKRRLAAG
ncbi:MAG: hypothetical protein ACRDWI_15405 [Jiangellaceae bacterium]